MVISAKPLKIEEKNVIGGFNLTDNAHEVIKSHKLTVQKFFAGTAYDSDEVWTRPSQALAKQLFVVGYIGLVASGTIALAVAAILIGVAS